MPESLPSRADRERAAFLWEYRQLCERYGLMVIHVYRENDYSPASLARFHRKEFDKAMTELHLEPIKTILDEEDEA